MSGGPIDRWVLLKHTLPDGSSHLDWMLDIGGTEGARLVTYRLERRPDDVAVTTLDALRLEDHRRVYLDYEGEISGGRGEVERVCSGTVRVLHRSEHEIKIELIEHARVWFGMCVAPDEARWTFTRG